MRDGGRGRYGLIARLCSCAGAALLVALSPSAAYAQGCGPTRLKIAEEVSLDTPPAQAWSLVGNFQKLGWDSDVRSVSGKGGNVPDVAVRHVTLVGGMALDESLYQYDAQAMTYAFHVDKLDTAMMPVQNMSVTLEVRPGADQRRSTLSWKAAFYRFLKPGEPAPDLADAAAREAVRRFASDQLAGLRAKVGSRS